MYSANIKKPIVKVFTRIDSIVEKQGQVKQGRTIIRRFTLDFHDAVCYDFYDALRRKKRCTGINNHKSSGQRTCEGMDLNIQQGGSSSEYIQETLSLLGWGCVHDLRRRKNVR